MDFLARLGLNWDPPSGSQAALLLNAVEVLDSADVFARLDTRSLTVTDAGTESVRLTPKGMATASCYAEDARWDSEGTLWWHTYAGDRVKPVDVLYWGFAHRRPEVGRLVADAFAGQGFTVVWDGDPDLCVQVHIGGAS